MIGPPMEPIELIREIIAMIDFPLPKVKIIMQK